MYFPQFLCEWKLKWILHGFLRLLIEYYDIHQNNTTRFFTSLLQDYLEEYYNIGQIQTTKFNILILQDTAN